jgi:predicted nuclease of restriction endonuclease-like (RecB) superfamily
MGSDSLQPGNTAALLADLRALVESTRSGLAAAINTGLTLLYWRIGQRIQQDVLASKRADYGKQIVVTLSRQLTQEFGRGFEEANLRRMIQFATTFPDEEIVVTLSRQLSWSHFLALLPLDKPLQREFYAEMCRVERWSVRVLRRKIEGMLFERTALSRKPEELIRKDVEQLREDSRLTPDLVFRDPYLLDFLGLKDHYLERDLEDAILRELEQFLLELGSGFAFLARQKRIQLDNDDYYLDLLFFHRSMNRLIAIDLKLGDFKAEYKGQMELYLRWLSRHERGPQELEPLGIILCAGHKHELVELLELGQAGIHVAEYLTELPAREVLEGKLRSSIAAARERLGASGTGVDKEQGDE